jgi:hypothetical protein
MRTALLSLITIALVGCATVEKQPQTLYKTFEQCREAIASGTVVAKREAFFTSKVLSEIDATSEADTEALKFAAYIDDERSHYEKMEKERGCLTVNGYGDNGDPVSLFIEYELSDGRWLTNFTRVFIPQ